jgi:hypothetical protein
VRIGIVELMAVLVAHALAAHDFGLIALASCGETSSVFLFGTELQWQTCTTLFPRPRPRSGDAPREDACDPEHHPRLQDEPLPSQVRGKGATAQRAQSAIECQLTIQLKQARALALPRGVQAQRVELLDQVGRACAIVEATPDTAEYTVSTADLQGARALGTRP